MDCDSQWPELDLSDDGGGDLDKDILGNNHDIPISSNLNHVVSKFKQTGERKAASILHPIGDRQIDSNQIGFKSKQA